MLFDPGCELVFRNFAACKSDNLLDYIFLRGFRYPVILPKKCRAHYESGAFVSVEKGMILDYDEGISGRETS